MPDNVRSKNGQGEDRKSRQRSAIMTISGPSTETVSTESVIRRQRANLLKILAEMRSLTGNSAGRSHMCSFRATCHRAQVFIEIHCTPTRMGCVNNRKFWEFDNNLGNMTKCML